MSDALDFKARLLGLPRQLLTNRLILVLLGILIVLESFNGLGLAVLLAREKAVAERAKGRNAALMQKSAADGSAEAAITAKLKADYAPRKQAAVARKARASVGVEAAALEKSEAEAAVAKAKSDADTAAATERARAAEEQAVVDQEIARYSARKLRIDTEEKGIGLALTRWQNIMRFQRVNFCTDCDPTYCILCSRHQVPDLPSGAALPDADAGESPQITPPKPKLNVYVSMFQWERNSPCDHDFQTFKATLPYSAMATGTNYGCDYAASKPDQESARRAAIAACYSHYHAQNCHVIAEIVPDAPPAPPKPRPEGKPVLIRVHAALFPLGGECRVAFDQWEKTGLYGAFAVSTHHCGHVAEKDDLETAKRDAMQGCGDSECYLVYVIDKAPDATPIGHPPRRLPIPTTPTADDHRAHAIVVPPQLNVHNAPNRDAATVGKLDHGQSTTIITGPGEGDFIAVEGTCMDGTPCKGYVNGRAEFVTR